DAGGVIDHPAEVEPRRLEVAPELVGDEALIDLDEPEDGAGENDQPERQQIPTRPNRNAPGTHGGADHTRPPRPNRIPPPPAGARAHPRAPRIGCVLFPPTAPGVRLGRGSRCSARPSRE